MTGRQGSIIERAVPALLLCAVVSSAQAQDHGALGNTSRHTAADQDSAVVDLTTRIIGGSLARPGQFPSIVALLDAGLFSPADRQFCGGTVIASRWVVTAAHCLFDNAGRRLDPANMRVVEQVLDLRAETIDEELMVTNAIVHPSYDHSSTETYHDIALLELSTALDSAPATLFSEDPEGFTGSTATVAGWGATSYQSPRFAIYPDALHQASLPLVSRAACNAPGSYDFIAQGQLCAGFVQGGVDACLGDSGGPLVTTVNGRAELIGVASFGRGCAEPNYYGIYTSVAFYLDWIGEYVSVQTLPRDTGGTPGGKGGGDVGDLDDGTGSGGGGVVGLLWLGALALLRVRRRVAAPKAGVSRGEPCQLCRNSFLT